MHYQLHDLETAAREFAESFQIEPRTELLFNLAQTHRLAKHNEQAIYFYKQFLAAATVSPSSRKVIKDRIAELEALITQQGRAQTAPPDGTQAPAQAPTTAAPVARSPVVTAAVATPAPVRRPWYQSAAGWAPLSVGVVIASVGLGLLVHGNQLDSQIPGANSLAEAQQLAHDRDAYRPSGIALISIGGAAAVAGAVVLSIAATREKSALRRSVLASSGRTQ
jgi:hypothetical protein